MEKIEYTIKATKITSIDQMNNICAANIGREVIPLIKTVDNISFQPCVVMAVKTHDNQEKWATDYEFYHIPLELHYDQYCHYELVNNIITPKEQ